MITRENLIKAMSKKLQRNDQCPDECGFYAIGDCKDGCDNCWNKAVTEFVDEILKSEEEDKTD